MRCPTTHGVFQCARDVGHAGECETEVALGVQGRIVTLDRDAQRELVKAAKRIAHLETELDALRRSACLSGGTSAACVCCVHKRAAASAALEGQMTKEWTKRVVALIGAKS